MGRTPPAALEARAADLVYQHRLGPLIKEIPGPGTTPETRRIVALAVAVAAILVVIGYLSWRGQAGTALAPVVVGLHAAGVVTALGAALWHYWRPRQIHAVRLHQYGAMVLDGRRVIGGRFEQLTLIHRRGRMPGWWDANTEQYPDKFIIAAPTGRFAISQTTWPGISEVFTTLKAQRRHAPPG